MSSQAHADIYAPARKCSRQSDVKSVLSIPGSSAVTELTRLFKPLLSMNPGLVCDSATLTKDSHHLEVVYSSQARIFPFLHIPTSLGLAIAGG